MKELRLQAKDVYKKCPLTSYHFDVCENAHIIPRSVCYRFQLEELIMDINNCILLVRDLHTLFDNFCWTFDVYSAEKVNDKQISIEILKSSRLPQKTSMNLAPDKIVLPINILPYLWVHYNVFIDINYTITTDTDQLFDKYLNSAQFRKIKKIGLLDYRDELQKTNRRRVILNQKNGGQLVLLLYDGYPLRDSQWVDEQSLPPRNRALLEQYHALLEYNRDPTFKL